MLVVADSSPLHYLILLDQAELLPRLFGNVLIPDAVAAELCDAASPRKISEWISNHAAWLRVVEVTAEDIVSIADELDAGERAAIALAERTGADLLLIDESAGRAEARRRSASPNGLGKWLDE